MRKSASFEQIRMSLSALIILLTFETGRTDVPAGQIRSVVVLVGAIVGVSQ